jgi:hypothetical protein
MQVSAVRCNRVNSYDLDHDASRSFVIWATNFNYPSQTLSESFTISSRTTVVACIRSFFGKVCIKNSSKGVCPLLLNGLLFLIIWIFGTNFGHWSSFSESSGVDTFKFDRIVEFFTSTVPLVHGE